MGRKYTHHATRASLPPIPSPPEDILANIPVIGMVFILLLFSASFISVSRLSC